MLLPVDEVHTAIVDAAQYPALSKYHWRIRRRRRCVYAFTRLTNHPNGRQTLMHRMIADTPPDMVCHHINHNTLDNRKANLLNMTRQAHDDLHQGNTCRVIFSPANTEKPD